MASLLLDIAIMLIAFGLGAYFVHRSNMTTPQGIAQLIVGVVALIVGLLILLAIAGVGIS